MSDIKINSTSIELGGKTYDLVFTTNIIDDIQEHFDIPITNIAELFKDEKKQFKVLRYLITALINESIDIHNDSSDKKLNKIDERYAGRYITIKNLDNYIEAIKNCLYESMPTNDEDDDDPNSTSGQ